MRVAIVTPVWGRLKLTRIWWLGVTRLQREWANLGIEAEVFVSGSEPAHRALCRLYGAEWVRCGNRPLGRKWNAALLPAWQSRADYLFILGQDDFIGLDLASQYARHMRQGTPYVGLRGIYFWEPDTGRSLLCPGYPERHKRYGEPIGAGRLIHRSLIPDGIGWDDHRKSGLDYSMTMRLKLPQAALIAVGPDAVAVDVKTDDNLWRFPAIARRYTRRDFRCEVLEDDPALQQLPEYAALCEMAEPVAA